MAVYGTNALKFADGDEEESRPFLLRELHIVQPKLVVVMGEQALAFLNSVKFPLARELAPTEGELQ
jgi:uracil-DNA glycosylase